MNFTYINAEHRHDAQNAWKPKEFTLDFRSRERYKKAVKILINNSDYKLLCNGRYLYGNVYGYVTFTRQS